MGLLYRHERLRSADCTDIIMDPIFNSAFFFFFFFFSFFFFYFHLLSSSSFFFIFLLLLPSSPSFFFFLFFFFFFFFFSNDGLARPTRQSGSASPLTLAAWNVCSLFGNPSSNRPERRMTLVARELARNKVGIAALSETGFSEQGQLEEVGAGYTFF
ncbi:hypothetical protein SprV_0401726500 [Sparganum proliferum]